LAVLRRFGRSALGHPVGTVEGVLDRVARGEADLALVPVENATEGLVAATLDAVVDLPPRITGELLLDVDHALVAAPGTPLASITVVHSHPQALGQCRRWLGEHLPGAALHEAPSTAEAARRAAEDPRSAAVASELAAAWNGLHVLHRRIQDHPLNQTRFWMVGGPAPERTGTDRTSLLIPGGRGPGSLLRLLGPFADRGLDLTRIESRPTRRPWSHVFFVELEGHATDPAVAAALSDLEALAPGLVCLGSYPRATAALPCTLPEEPLP
jgi:chorismate mutase/prephenate dehydratase